MEDSAFRDFEMALCGFAWTVTGTFLQQLILALIEVRLIFSVLQIRDILAPRGGAPSHVTKVESAQRIPAGRHRVEHEEANQRS